MELRLERNESSGLPLRQFGMSPESLGIGKILSFFDAFEPRSFTKAFDLGSLAKAVGAWRVGSRDSGPKSPN